VAERTGEAAEVVRLGRGARSWRAALIGLLLLLFWAGSLVGDDPWWPFGPWRMFSTSQAPTGAVVSTEMQIQTAADSQWTPAGITPESVGLNRAEVEGRLHQIAADPAMLGTLAASHARLRPDAPRWNAVRIVQRKMVIHDRVPTGQEQVDVLATWVGR
jgi:hypothetical protein